MGQMIFTSMFAYCQHCEMHWTLGEHGWIPDDPSYKGPKKQQYKNKNWKRKT